MKKLINESQKEKFVKKKVQQGLFFLAIFTGPLMKEE